MFTLKRILLQVEFPEGYLLDVGWYGKFIIYIIKNYSWDNPIMTKKFMGHEKLEKNIKKAVLHIRELLAENKKI